MGMNAQITTVTKQNTIIKSNHNLGLTNPLFDQGSPMQYDAALVDTNGAAFSFNFTNPGGTGYKGYPSGAVGGYSSGGTYYPGVASACGMPVLISALQHNLRIKWKVSQSNANDPDDKWWASINVIFDSGTATSMPDPNVRDYDLVIASKQYTQEDLNDEPKVIGGGAYWYFARNTDGSLKTFDLNFNGTVYKYALRYKFFSYNPGDPNEDKNDKVHTKFIPVDNNNVAPYLDHSLKLFIQTTKDYLQYANLPSAELTLANQKVADPNLYVKSITAGYEVYTGSFTVNNDYFYTVIDNSAPAATTGLTISKSGNNYILDWPDHSDPSIDSYKVYRSENASAFSLLADNVPTSNFTDATTTAGNIYKYYIIAQDRSFNLSLPSNTVSNQNNSFTPQQMVVKMGRGINLGNILSAGTEGAWAPALTEDYVDNVARAGFKTVRIPIRFDNQTTPFSAVTYSDVNGNYIGSPAQYTVNATYLNRINTILDWCTSRGLVAIIDVHGDHWFWGSFNPNNKDGHYKTGNDRLAAIDRFKAIWRDISTTFQNKPETVLFEIMNEAYFDMGASDVDFINAEMLAIIRQTNPTRNVIVNGGGNNSWEAPLQMSDAFLQSDNHLIATFHYYLPFKFTSSATQSSPDFDWGTAADKATVDSHFNQVKTWSLQKNIPVYLGEFGADNVGGYNYASGTSPTGVGPDAASRYAYHQYVAQAAIDRGFSLTVWDAGDESGKTIYIVTNKSWVKDIRNAVLGAASTSYPLVNNANIGENYDYSWNLIGTSGTINNALPTDSYNGATLNVNNSTAAAFNTLILANDIFTSGFTPGQTYTIKFYAKGDAGQQIRVRMRKVNSSNVITNPIIINSANLTNNFTQYTASYTVDADTQSLQLQLLCGLNAGNYFFDDFEVTTNTLGTNEATLNNSVSIFPNPAKNSFEIQSNKTVKSVEVYSQDGKLILTEKNNTKINLPNVNSGIYLVRISTSDAVVIKKLIVNQ